MIISFYLLFCVEMGMFVSWRFLIASLIISRDLAWNIGVYLSISDDLIMHALLVIMTPATRKLGDAAARRPVARHTSTTVDDGMEGYYYSFI
jgi:hypothetical protein